MLIISRNVTLTLSNLALFADDTCLYVTVLKESYILRKLQCGLL
jgi:hypothetical protein